MSRREKVYLFSGKVQRSLMVRCVAPLLCLAITAVGASAQNLGPQQLAQAVDNLVRLDTAIRDGRPMLNGLFFGPRTVNGSCMRDCLRINVPCQLWSVPYRVDYGIPALKPKLENLLDEQKRFSDEFMPRFQIHLSRWSRTVSKVSQDLDELSEQAAALKRAVADGNEGEIRNSRRDITHSFHRTRRDLHHSSNDLSKITEDIAVYVQKQEPLQVDFAKLRAELDSSYTKLDERANLRQGQFQCTPVSDSTYTDFKRDVSNSVDTLRAVYDSVSRGIEGARLSTGVLLGATTTMSSQIDLVAKELDTARGVAGTNAAVASFRLKMAVEVWRDFAAHAATVIE